MKKIIFVFYVLFIISFISACKNDNKSVYTIEGRLIDGTNPKNLFANRILKFQNEINHKDIKLLGETITDEYGKFSFSYEFEDDYKVNLLRIVIDSTFIGSRKLAFLELGSNWNKTFYLGDSALLDININVELKSTDTLYISNSDSIYKIIGPCFIGKNQRIKCINYTQNGLIGYGVGWSNFYNFQRIIQYIPTGEPIIDEIELDIK